VFQGSGCSADERLPMKLFFRIGIAENRERSGLAAPEFLRRLIDVRIDRSDWRLRVIAHLAAIIVV
jgi:hypothetical protein